MSDALPTADQVLQSMHWTPAPPPPPVADAPWVADARLALVLFGLAFAAWLVTSGWWVWFLKVVAILAAGLLTSVFVAPSAGVALDVLILSVMAWPRLKIVLEAIAFSRNVQTRRGERLDRMLDAFDQRLSEGDRRGR